MTKLYAPKTCPKCKGKGKIRQIQPAALRERRKKSGLSLEALGKIIGFGKMHLSNIETGKRRATPKIINAYQKL